MARIENKHIIQGRIIFVGMPEPLPNYPSVTKRVLVIDQENPRSSTPWEVPIEFFNNEGDLLNGLKAGQLVDVTFGARGRKTLKDGRAKWWPTLDGIMVSKVTG